MAASSSRAGTFPYLITGVIVIAVSFYIDVRYDMYPEVSRYLGMFLVVLGLACVFWSTLVARDAVLGEIEPRSGKLIQRGPFALIRHPMYLGFTIALFGIAVSARSWPGMICVFVLFVPSAILRARLEEKALARKFGDEWQRYAAGVPFMLPRFRRNPR